MTQGSKAGLLAAVATSVACLLSLPAQAAGAADNASPPPAMSAPALDPALRRAFTGLAAALVAGLAANVASDSAGDFDPGPILEKGVRQVLASGEFDRVVDGLVGRILDAGADNNAAMAPEFRAALALLLKAASSRAKQELLREFSSR